MKKIITILVSFALVFGIGTAVFAKGAGFKKMALTDKTKTFSVVSASTGVTSQLSIAMIDQIIANYQSQIAKYQAMRAKLINDNKLNIK